MGVIGKMKISRQDSHSTVGAPSPAVATAYLEGLFVGLNGSGVLTLGDYRASASAIRARGALKQDLQQKDPKGNVLSTIRDGSYTYTGKISGITADGLGLALTPGADYYLYTGGTITKTKPAATTDDIDQMVGYALSATELQIQIGQPIIHA